MRGCTRCSATYPAATLFCPKDGAPTHDLAAAVGAPSAARPSLSPLSSAPVSPAPASALPSADPFVGKMAGNFRLGRRIGEGGMGAVYEGVHPLVGIRVAVKLLGGRLALDRELVDRFFAEARTLNQVAHENIVRVIDLGAHPEGFYYCVMELLEGDTLAGIVHRGRVELPRALNFLIQACDALAAAHEKGIVHRDLKPANVMLVRHPMTGGELVKLVDFGIAKLQSAEPQASATLSGTVIGTPAYMSPEQAAGRIGEIDARSDLYSLGIVAYELLTGHHPFEGRAVGELIVAQVTETPPPPSRVFSLPPRLDEAVMRLLRKRRDERFQDAASVGRELRAIAESLRRPVVEVVSQPLREPPPLAEVPLVFRDPPPPQRDPTPPREPLPPPRPVAPPAPFLAASPAPVVIARRENTLPPGGTPGTGVRLATRQKPSKRRARPFFLLAFVLSGAALGAALVGALDAEPLVASAAHALGLAPPPVRVKRAAPPSLDGTNGVFNADPRVATCRPALEGFRGQPMPAAADTLKPMLFARLGALQQLADCVAAVGQARPASAWAASYIEAVADFEFALALDRLPPDLRASAEALHDGPTAPFYAELYAHRAADRFGSAYAEAPETHKGYIDNFHIELDALKQRQRTRAQAAAAKP